MRFERELPGCWATYYLSDNRWAVVSPDSDPFQPATHVVRVVTEKSFAPAVLVVKRH
jgi:hypothetical protein